MFKPKGPKSVVPFGTSVPKTPSGAFSRNSSPFHFPDSGILTEKLFDDEESSGQIDEISCFANPVLQLLFSFLWFRLCRFQRSAGFLLKFWRTSGTIIRRAIENFAVGILTDKVPGFLQIDYVGRCLHGRSHLLQVTGAFMNAVSDRLKTALAVAADAGELILQHYRIDGLLVESKADESPVTVADRGAELLIRKKLLDAYPGDAILGEEFPGVDGTTGFRWIIDPIDGTKAFVHGVPLFGTLIGLEFDGRMVAGVCRFPAMDEVVYAAEGFGCWWKIRDMDPRRTFVAGTSDIRQARLMFTEPTHWRQTHRFDTIVRVMDQVRIARGWGDCYGHAMVATGRAEIAIDPLMSAWDIAALIPILREAGGSCTDWMGQETVFGGDGVSVVPALRDEVIEILRTAPPLPRKS